MTTGQHLLENPGEISRYMIEHRWSDLVELVEYVNSDAPKDEGKLELYRKLGWGLLNKERLQKLAFAALDAGGKTGKGTDITQMISEDREDRV
jgi:hypothetical protein